MKGALLALLGLAAALPGQTPTPASGPLKDLDKILAFEMPRGWGVSRGVSGDREVVHGGQGSIRLERASGSSPVFINKAIPIDFTGRTIELRGFLRTLDVDGFAGLWIHLEGETSRVAAENMERRQLKGNTDWAEYSISMPLDSSAKQLVFGVELSGTGKAWADDLQLLVDGKPVWEAWTCSRQVYG